MEQPQGLFRLSKDLREAIYRLTLLDGRPLWARRHTAACPLSPRDATTWESPPWAVWQFPGQSRPTAFDCCRCVARTGLGLLLACRQAHDEAAPIFWGENVHCFADMPQLIGDVGERMRPESRALLRHVSVAIFDDNRSRFARHRLDVWPVLSRCRALETLELDLEQARGGVTVTPARLISDMLEDHRAARGLGGRNPARAKLPSFRRLTIAKVLQYHVAAADYDESGSLGIMHVKYSQPLDLEAARDRDSTVRALRAFEERFLPEARAAVASQVLDPSRHTWQGPTPVCFLGRALDDLRYAVRLRLREGSDETTEVQFFGTPLSAETLKANEEERAREAAYRKSHGLLTAEEERVRRGVEKEERMRKRVELERQMEEAKELRKVERKRVMPAAHGGKSGGD
ncbi:hypothetical protein MAPG_09466 [Magnaporthiopsis poae ATCC 64411]|uniref:Uncharacterized protein n=1 Tax=Magnaporthiopsis poae (strain ATCC 64411 / 73-15) TaxID=644358 RepID=A0A0C4EA12_MAGP6|nr:hypothetical protein MAPG_09466 [Magnaporthiopsis poae ATCC 64411]